MAWERRHLFVMVRERSLSLKFGRKGERYLLIARVREIEQQSDLSVFGEEVPSVCEGA